MLTSTETTAPPRRRTTGVPANVLARHAVEGLLSKKGLDVRVLDVRGVSGVADFFLIASGESDLQVRAMVDAVRAEVLDATDERPWHVEGTDHHQWVVIDYVDLVVHVFLPERRAFYGLERLWGDAPMEEVPDTGSGDTVALLRDDAPVPKSRADEAASAPTEDAAAADAADTEATPEG